jgi:hypothetical protein
MNPSENPNLTILLPLTILVERDFFQEKDFSEDNIIMKSI